MEAGVYHLKSVVYIAIGMQGLNPMSIVPLTIPPTLDAQRMIE